MKMKNIILIIFTLIIGVAEALGQYILNAGRWQPTHTSGTYSADRIEVVDNKVVIYNIPKDLVLTIPTSPANANGRTGAKPGILLPEGATLVITGEGTLNLTGGNAADGVVGGGSNGGNGGGGAAPGIGGIGGTGGKGNWTSDESKYGTSGTGMGKLYILGKVKVNVQKGKEGESKVGTAFVGGGEGGQEPTYAIGGGGRGGHSKDGYSTAPTLTVNNGYIFIQNTENVTYKNAQGETDASQPDVETEPTLKLEEFGYTFNGYRVGETWVVDATGGLPDGGSNFDKTISVLDEYWTKTITLDQQGGTDGSTSINAVFGCSLPTASAPTKTGYSFMGYFTEPNGGGTQYYYPDMSSKKNIWDDETGINTLYAHWAPISYSITLVKQGGTGGTEEIEVTYDSAMPSATAPTRTGFTFNGYFYNPDGTGTKYYNGDMTSAHVWDVSIVPDGGFKLYAHWTPTIYTVNLDKQGGTDGTSSVTVTYGGFMPTVLPNDDPVTAPTRTGFTFAGYYSGENGTGTRYYNENMESVNNWDIDTNPCTLYAHWTGTYTLTFDVNGGNPLVPNSKEVIYNNEYGELPTPIWTGHTFDGWFTSETGGDQVTSETKMGDTDVTIYAHWTIITYTVTLYLEGGSGGTTSVEVTYGSTMPSATAPTRPGYIFGGYFTGTNGTGTQYYNVDMTSAHNWVIDVYPINSGKLYANWTPITYTVTFNPQKGSVDQTTKGVNYGNTYGELPTPTRHGFLFKGWYTTKNGGSEDGTEITGSETYSIIGNQTLYAHWNTTSFEIDAYSEERLAGFYFRTFFDSQVTCILPAGVTAYKGNIDGRYLVLTAIVATDDIGNNVIPKNVPVILRMDPNDNTSETVSGFPTIQKKTITLTTTEYDHPEFTNDNNGLTGSDDGIATAPANSYILSFGSKGLGFYAWATHPLEGHKAYVINPSGSSAKALIFRFEDDAAGISQDAITDFDSDDSELVIHNLNGIRISKPQKGINIINGKKVWVK